MAEGQYPAVGVRLGQERLVVREVHPFISTDWAVWSYHADGTDSVRVAVGLCRRMCLRNQTTIPSLAS